MNVLIIYAHPEPKSLNGSLKDFAVDHLTKSGHDVKVSDLYAMGWKAVLDAGDFPAWEDKEHLLIAPASAQAYADHTGRYATDCAALSRRLDDLWTDTPIPYRKQNGGDYEIPSLTLKPTVETKAADGTVQSGFRLHSAPLTSLPK